MADSIHTRIVDAVIARLNSDIRKSNGYNHDLATDLGGGGAQHVQEDYQTKLEAPYVIVDLWQERMEEMNPSYQVTGSLHLAAGVQVPIDGTPIRTALQRFVDDIMRCLGQVRTGSTPMLGVEGLEDIRIYGHTKLPRGDDDHNLEALFESEVIFQVAIDDPTKVI